MQKSKKVAPSENHRESYSNKEELVKKNILGVGVTDASKEKILEFVIKNLKKNQKPYYIVTPNPEMLVLASKNSEFKKVLNTAKLASNDGVGLTLAAKILGVSLKERFTGVDLVEKVCENVANWSITVGFLGAGPKIAEKTAECLIRKYPGLKVVFAGEEWKDFWGPVARQPHVHPQGNPGHGAPRITPPVNDSRASHPSIDILFVALGAPKQEFWMAEHVGEIDVKVMIGVGGAFDYISGAVPRAPKFVRQLGLEWLFRLIVQPWRIKRQLALLEFMWLIAREKMGKGLSY